MWRIVAPLSIFILFCLACTNAQTNQTNITNPTNVTGMVQIPIAYANLSSAGTNPGRVLDGDLATNTQTSVQYNPFMQFSLTIAVRVMMIVISINEPLIDPYPFCLFVSGTEMAMDRDYASLYNDNSIYHKIITHKARNYTIYLPDMFTKTIRVAHFERIYPTYLSLGEVEIFQMRRILKPDINYLLYSSKPPYNFGTFFDKYIEDTNVNTFAHTGNQITKVVDGVSTTLPDYNPYIEFLFRENITICAVAVWNRWYHEIASFRLTSFVLALKEGPITYVENQPDFASVVCSSDPGVKCTEATGVQEMHFIKIPNVRTDRVRIMQRNTDFMNIAELHAFYC